MPKKTKAIEYELALSDEEEAIKVKMIEKKAPRKKIERTEEAKAAMLKRLEEGRKKAFEVRMKNKAEREKLKEEEKEKTEKVNSYLKNEDIFEKKYSSKFERLEDILIGIDNNFKEIKEYKKNKREKLEQREKQELEKKANEVVKENVATPQTETTPLIAKPQTEIPTKPTEKDLVIMATRTLPNYRVMKFGRAIF